jgi:hypothetical protein
MDILKPNIELTRYSETQINRGLYIIQINLICEKDDKDVKER